MAHFHAKDQWSSVREKYFVQRIKQAGHDVAIYPLSQERKKRELELNRLAKWLLKLPHPIGIMACNDERSIDVVEACHLVDLKIV